MARMSCTGGWDGTVAGALNSNTGSAMKTYPSLYRTDDVSRIGSGAQTARSRLT